VHSVYLPLHTLTHPTRTVGKRIKHILHIVYLYYVCVCVCVQNDAPYGRNETESRTGLFTSMECSSSTRSLVVVRFVNIMHRGLKSAAAASASGNIDRAIFVFLFSAYGSRLPPMRAVDITVGLVYIIPRYRNNYIPSIYIYSDDCGIRRRTILYSRYLPASFYIYKTIIITFYVCKYIYMYAPYPPSPQSVKLGRVYGQNDL